MTEKHNATCKICGKSYYACMSCADSIKAHPWKAFTDNANCYKVFQVVRGLSTGVYTKDEAKEKFKNINLSDIESFRPHIKDIIKDVLREDEVVVETIEKIEDTVVEDITEVKLKETEAVKSVVKPIVSRKKNYRVETE